MIEWVEALPQRHQKRCSRWKKLEQRVASFQRESFSDLGRNQQWALSEGEGGKEVREAELQGGVRQEKEEDVLKTEFWGQEYDTIHRIREHL